MRSNEEQIKILKTELSAKESHRRYEAAILIGSCKEMLGLEPNTDLLDLLESIKDDKDNHVRYYVAEAIGNLELKQGLPILEVMLYNETEDIQDGPSPIISIKKSIEHLSR